MAIIKKFRIKFFKNQKPVVNVKKISLSFGKFRTSIAIIIDDEKKAQEVLAKMLNKYCGEIDIVAIAVPPNLQIKILKELISRFSDGYICFEFTIPRMGLRADVILIVEGIIFILEFKVGESDFLTHDRRQVEDYALDLKNFHKGSHNKIIVPIMNSSWDDEALDVYQDALPNHEILPFTGSWVSSDGLHCRAIAIITLCRIPPEN